MWDVETPSPTIYNNKFFSYAIADCRLVQSECVYARKREQGAASRCGTAGANYALKKGGNIRPLRYYALRIFPAETQERMNIAADTITMIIGARLTLYSRILLSLSDA